MVEKRVAIKNMIVGIVLYGVNKIENIESNIAKYNALMEKKPDDQIKKTLTRYQTRLAENMRLLRYCAKNNIAIIYKK
jgi:hypothetical protein